VELIPATQKETTLGTIEPGTRVNIEADTLVKAVRHTMLGIMAAEGGELLGSLKADWARE
jgi:riboflavin synthase alpha subunit